MEEYEERFFSKVNKTDTCWFWTATIVNGYGQFSINNKNYRAHRISWFIIGNTIPDDKPILRHKCKNKHCVNPEHLEIGTAKDNRADQIRDGTNKRPGEKCGASKLTNVQVISIRQRKDECWHALAKEFDVGYNQIYRIIARKRWSHLE